MKFFETSAEYALCNCILGIDRGTSHFGVLVYNTDLDYIKERASVIEWFKFCPICGLGQRMAIERHVRMLGGE
jgi:hypothetical protein